MIRKTTANAAHHAATLAGAIVNTLRVPLLVLDGNLRVIAASPSFSQTFQVQPDETIGRLLFDLGNGQWDIPALRHLLENVIPRHTTMEAFEVEHEFPQIGHRVMSLDARETRHPEADSPELLLVIEDITERRAAERAQQELVRQKELLLAETQHRINNTLQIIANILLLKARAVRSEELRRHLHDAHERVVSVVAMQDHLQAVGLGANAAIGPYLTRLCGSLGHSMISERRSIKLEVTVNGDVVTSGEAVQLGLITTELVINALKHAFPGRNTGRILISYEITDGGWVLSVSDDGVGFPTQHGEKISDGLGTGIVEVLARQLGGRVKVATGARGTTVSVLGTTGASKDDL